MMRNDRSRRVSPTILFSLCAISSLLYDILQVFISGSILLLRRRRNELQDGFDHERATDGQWQSICTDIQNPLKIFS